jgi:uncharacterized membrane protein
MAKKRNKSSGTAGTPVAATQRAAATRTDPQARHPAPDWPAVVIAGIGLLITAYLSIVALSGAPPALCSTGSSCDLIQQSHWSRLFGIPIALWGFLTYALILLAALLPSTRLRRWRRLWTLSVVGLAVSLYLTAIGLIELQAVCGWCLASLATMGTLFVLVSLRRPAAAPGAPWLNWSMSHAALLLAVLGVMQLYYSGLFSPRPEPRLQALALHLKESGALFYGASWCPTCNQQKALFGGAAKDLPYVECSPGGRGGPLALDCLNAGIQNYPTWIIRGRRYPELMQPDDLARRTGFDWEAAPVAADAGP